ncbi:hypothetical protein FHR99_001792 [Litorivivens lipolytica]|uniref:Haemolysin activator HlyB C-terminal domain-containing protein n=1 Tax=Litorivivens lipolytica TaxID=1524264 RepID=A0A7W4W4W2_9GAMM|nr:ShlB/FhaC/HecB family hemolysin secretion/activation protein [Litorivivens lipolytica]MBB3047526.1 hypothetical protein [Litorivivens lipolytica]
MAIDLPPALPPQAADSALIRETKAADSSYIGGKLGNVEVRVFGNRSLDQETILSVIANASAPSEVVKDLTRAYYDAGFLWVKLFYYRVEDIVGVIVSQSVVSEVRGDERITPHFESLVGDADPTLAEYDTARVLAALKSERIGENYTVTYEDLGNQQLAVVLESSADEDYDNTDYIFELNNKGSRYLGRYFGLAGLQHRTDSGTKWSFAYQRAFIEWGESLDGEKLNQYSLSVDHPFSFGLYGIDLSYVEYERDPEGQLVQPGSCSLLFFCTGPTVSSTRLDVQAEIQRFGVRGQQVIYSDTQQRLRLKERVEYVDSYIEENNSDTILIDERYPVAEVGVLYNSRFQNDRSSFNAGLDARVGLSSSGTLDTYDEYRRAFLAQNPSASEAPDVAPAARSGEFVTLQPSVNYQYALSPRTVFSATLKGQYANEQVPEQEQFVLGGMDSLGAYLPGILIGDEGFHLKLEVSRSLSWKGVTFRPALFIEQGQTWYNNTDGDLGDAQKVADAGFALSMNFGHGLESHWVVARNVSDDVIDEALLEASEADFFWRLRLTL